MTKAHHQLMVGLRHVVRVDEPERLTVLPAASCRYVPRRTIQPGEAAWACRCGSESVNATRTGLIAFPLPPTRTPPMKASVIVTVVDPRRQSRPGGWPWA